MMKKVFNVLIVLILVSVLAACSGNQTASDPLNGSNSSGSADGSKKKGEDSKKEEAKEWVPKDDFEFVVPYSPGGGSDTNARALINVIKKNNLTDRDFVVVNKAGGSGMVGMAYTYSKKDDPYTIQTFISGQLTGAVLTDAEVTVDDLTPIATLAIDSFAFVVDKDSPYKTFADIAKASRENPDQITIGGTGKGSEDHLVFYLLNKYADTKFKYVTFQSGGETTSAVLGGHIDATITNPNEVLSQVQAGEMRVLATAAEERLSAPFDTKTFEELGFPEVKLTQFRGYVGPPGMPQEAVEWWQNLLKKASETKDWQEGYIKKNSLQGVYKNAEESKKYWGDVLDHYLTLLEEVGVYQP